MNKRKENWGLKLILVLFIGKFTIMGATRACKHDTISNIVYAHRVVGCGVAENFKTLRL